ncbi:MAG: hypothetical protein K2J58_02145, partial [Muribaculaceae bacterium]|nr:hypothetical protein [Muribaculaceae bacterium]
DIMTYNTPTEYLQHDRFSNFFRSLISLSIPTIDTREGGFGILMLPMLAVALYAVWIGRKKSGYVPLYICACVFVSCFFFEQSWWARYITQLWLIPVVGIVVAVCYGVGMPRLRVSAQVILVGALLTGCLSVCTSVVAAFRQTLYRHAVEHSLEGHTLRVCGLNEAHRMHLKEADIEAIAIDSVSDSDWLVPYYGLLYDAEHYPVLILDSMSYVRVRSAVDAIPVFDYSMVFDEKRNVVDE